MHQEREKLKSDLRKLKETEFIVREDDSVIEHVRLMLKYIGDTDSELRDELIFEAFYYWIKVYKYFSEEQLKEMLLTLIDNEHLFYRIGDHNHDSVFLRSFSMLTLSVLISCQKEVSFLDKETFHFVKNALIRYYNKERDFRGYVDKKGWAHSVAHGADALNELVQCQDCDEFTHKEVLASIKQVLFNKTHILCYKEDDRIANVVYSIVEAKRISYDAIVEWLNTLTAKCSFNKGQEDYVSSINFRNFIRSFYFKLEYYKSETKMLNSILEIEKKLNSTNK